MKVSLLTSGFPEGFTQDFTDCVTRHYDGGTFLFVASDFDVHNITDKYAGIFTDMFKKAGVEFEDVHILDSRMPKDEAKEHIENAGIVWLTGGDTLKQISYIKEYELIDSLKNRNGLTIGISAGSINMAKKAVLARDPREDIEELQVYDGIGRVDINIEPHLNDADSEHLWDVIEASNVETIYGLFDGAFVEVIDDEAMFYGDYIKYIKC